MMTLKTMLVCLTIWLYVLEAQTIIWYEPMNSTAILLWTGVTPTVLTNTATCPGPYGDCWRINAASSASIRYTASTLQYTNVHLSYYASANGIKGQDSCSISYSTDDSNWNTIRFMSSDNVISGPYTAWQNTVDNIPKLTIRLSYTGRGRHSCYFSEFKLIGTPITPQPTASTSPTLSPGALPTDIPSYSSTYTTPTHRPSSTLSPSVLPTDTSSYSFTYTTPITSTSPTLSPSALPTDMSSYSSTYTAATTHPNSHNIVNLKCNASECKNRNMYCGSDVCNITCTGQHACTGSIIYAYDADTLSVQCLYTNACHNITVFAMDSNAFVLACDAEYACKGMVIAAIAPSITINATSKHALSNSTLALQSTSDISVTCASKCGESACYKNTWNLLLDSANRTNIHYFGGGCETFGDMHTNRSIAGLHVDVYGCGECWSASDCIDTWIFPCDDCSPTFTDFLAGRDTSDCGCSEMKDNIVFGDDSQCIKWKYSIKDLLNLPIYVYIAIGVLLCCMYCVLRCWCKSCKKSQYQKPSSDWTETKVDTAPVVVQTQPQALPIMYVDSLDMVQVQQPQIVHMLAPSDIPMHGYTESMVSIPSASADHVHVSAPSDIPKHGYAESIASAPYAPAEDIWEDTPPPAYVPAEDTPPPPYVPNDDGVAEGGRAPVTNL
eukprot:675183_1